LSQGEFEIRDGRALMRIKEATCQGPGELMRSELVRQVVEKFLQQLAERDSPLLAVVSYSEESADEMPGPGRMAERLVDALRLLVDAPADTVREMVPGLAPLLRDPLLLAELVERLYDFWRTQERYLIFEASAESSRDRALEGHTDFIQAHERIPALVLEAYRRIEANLRGHWPRTYRQVSAGANMSLLVEKTRWACPPGPYEMLREVRLVRLALIEPPVVLYPRRNHRQGRFEPVTMNPLAGVSLDPAEWLCMPVKVGPLVVFVFFHEEYLCLGTSLVNLFELAGHDEARRKPDGIVVFGVPPEALGEQQTVFYEDDVNDLMLGVIGRTEDVDYFGYFKKMALTLHNLIMMRRGRLPFHGAMCRIELKSGAAANVVIVGDSGAGKSESLEAFRVLADQHLRGYTIIADDMGSIEVASDGRIRGYGTEIGAFIRLDDLQPGYAFGQIDRSILMNPHRTNARLVIPVATLEDVTAGYPVDLFLYANNYEQTDDEHPALQMFDSPEHALHVFGEGYRAAKGTSDEIGLVHTYFGNPFGPVQRRELHDRLAKHHFDAMFAAGVKVGQLRTRLGIPGFEQNGPESAAQALFEAISDGLSGRGIRHGAY
jgi:hypothetical protein